MDLLFVLKSTHESFFAQIIDFKGKIAESKADVVDLAEFQDAINNWAILYSEFLAPELEEFEGVNLLLHDHVEFLEDFSEKLQSLLSRLKKSRSDAGKKDIWETLVVLADTLYGYLENAEKELYPGIRQEISTVEREEIGRELIDFQKDQEFEAVSA